MSNPKPNGKPAVTEGTGARDYDTATPATAKKSRPGVYDAPSPARGLPIGLIVGIVVAVLIIAFLVFHFPFAYFSGAKWNSLPTCTRKAA